MFNFVLNLPLELTDRTGCILSNSRKPITERSQNTYTAQKIKSLENFIFLECYRNTYDKRESSKKVIYPFHVLGIKSKYMKMKLCNLVNTN